MQRPGYDGFLNLDKPPGVTSRDVVNRVVRLIGRSTKAGHAGTLDPLASGVLVVALGAATRLIEHVQGMPKVYRTTIRLGATSDTLDADGTIVAVSEPRIPTVEDVLEAISAQVGRIEQVPPRYSALKVAGKRAYDLVRSGAPVELAARPVRIDRVDMLAYTWPRLELEVSCGGGTYIRSIARDIGEALGCGGLVEILRRTRIGPFAAEDALDPERLTLPLSGLRPLLDALPGWPTRTLDREQLALVARGRELNAGRLSGGAPPAGNLALLDPTGRLVALAEHDEGRGRVLPRKVLGLFAE